MTPKQKKKIWNRLLYIMKLTAQYVWTRFNATLLIWCYLATQSTFCIWTASKNTTAKVALKLEPKAC